VIVPAEPLFFRPIYKETIWGGRAFGTRFKRPLPTEGPVGESWEITSVGADQSVVAQGPLAGTSLDRLVAESPAELLGPIETFGKFPLLYKFIDAHDRLSVQVHPDDRQARNAGWGEFGKTECWYVVDAKENARIVVGFKESVSRETIGRAIETASLQELLSFIPVKAGDLLYIPAGTVHAILDGTLLYEVQETSDTTLRLYDWGRVDATGKPRQLHVRDALSVIDSGARDPYRIHPVILEHNGLRHSYRCVCRYFALEQYSFLRDGETLLPPKTSFRVLSVIEGTVQLHYKNGCVEATAGTTALLPAVLRDARVSGAAGSTFLVSSVPDIQKEIIAPLRGQGISDDAIELLGGPAGKNNLTEHLRQKKQ
jgi:mannose-6-phosphate isomerase